MAMTIALDVNEKESDGECSSGWSSWSCLTTRKISLKHALYACVMLFCIFTQASRLAFTAPARVAAAAPRLDVQIVYNAFINLKRNDWLDVITLQLQGIVSNGLADHASQIYVCLSTEYANETDVGTALVLRTAVDQVIKIIPKARVEATILNRFEYPGIRRVWDISNKLSEGEAKETVLLYFHSKGMFNTKEKGSRDKIERLLSSTVIDAWTTVLHRFAEIPTLNKAGYAASEQGFIWLNFWFARASYLQMLVNPVITDNRYYYEDWLGRVDKKKLWPKLWQIEFPLAHTSENSSAGLESPNELGDFSGGAKDCLSLCKPNLPIGTHFTSKTVWRCKPRNNWLTSLWAG